MSPRKAIGIVFEMNLLIELVTLHNQGRDDFFVGGNMFIYFDVQQAQSKFSRAGLLLRLGRVTQPGVEGPSLEDLG